MSNPAHERAEQSLSLWPGAVVVLVLAPFVGKALHIDDPLFVWTARQILVAPLDFYGFDVNWYGVNASMAVVNKNPPLVSYYLAALGGTFGFSQAALHLGMWLPALALVYGIAALAREFGINPILASVVSIATPAFMVAATSLMSDVTMLAFGIWGLLLAVRAVDSQRVALACCAGGLLGLAVLTKYFALAFVPLVIVYGVMRGRGHASWLLACSVAGLMVAGFDAAYAVLYGVHPIADVMGYATGADAPLTADVRQRLAVGLFFLGGCTLGPALFAPALWTRREAAALVFVGGLLAAFCVHVVAAQTDGFDLALHQAVFALVGVHWLALSAKELHRARDPIAVVLACWIGGVFVFAAFTNWTTNGRSILPAVPAIGLLVARAVERRGAIRWERAIAVLAASVALAGAVAWGDARLADSGREAARHFAQRQGLEADAKLVFQGSWGFQYYMESHGIEKFEVGRQAMRPGDQIVVPGNNTNLVRVPEARTRQLSIETFEKADWISILARRRGAGYHASVWGALPFSFGTAVPARYALYEFERPWSPKRRGARSGRPTE
ncbi:MAG: glycosyltransferase family 39 protein [Myxococcota bacterium]|jgi:hypothetical protein|nr:glycosyltransferase family 39 protein [Myxococcota bacterium]